MSDPRSEAFCIIGAGACGLAVAKTFRQAGIPFELLEREADIGGLWNIDTPSGVVYETTHLVSAKSSTDFDDFPMPETEYPEYPSHTQVLAYFRRYADHFGITDAVQFGTTVTSIAPRADGTFAVAVAGEPAPRLYRGVVLANGHHSAPRTPRFPGTFTGEIIHSRAYRSPRQVRDKRVLIVGAGNSACDIARDAVHNGARTVMSLRRGYWFVPKFMLGFPTHDVVSFVEAFPLPRFIKRAIFQTSVWVLQGPPSRYGLPDPDYGLDQAHPTLTDDIPRLAAHGRLTVRPQIERFDGENVIFADGTSEPFDLIVMATGYAPSVPFVSSDLMFEADGRPRFYLNAFHREHDFLFAAGLVQASGSIWRTADYQAQVIARFIRATSNDPTRAEWFRKLKARAPAMPDRQAFVASDRHTLETNYYVYRGHLHWLMRKLGPLPAATIAASPPQVPAARDEPAVAA